MYSYPSYEAPVSGDLVGSIFGDAWKSVSKVARSAVKSPFVKMAATGAAFVCPAVGVPAVAGLAAASKLMAASKSKDPKQRPAAIAAITNAVKLAAKGDPDAKRGVKLLQVAKQTATKLSVTKRGAARVASVKRPVKVAAGKSTAGLLVLSSGRIVRGTFAQV